MKLYEIKDEMLEVLDMLDSMDDDLAQENCNEMLEYLQEQLKEKSDSIIKYIRNIETEIGVAKDEITRLQEINKSKEKKLNWLKEYLVRAMLQLNEKKITTNLGTYGIRKSTKVDIIDMDKLPNEYIKIKTEFQPDKVKIGEFLKNHGNLNGARLVENYSLQIR